jgi:hypothetical protein
MKVALHWAGSESLGVIINSFLNLRIIKKKHPTKCIYKEKELANTYDAIVVGLGISVLGR